MVKGLSKKSEWHLLVFSQWFFHVRHGFLFGMVDFTVDECFFLFS